MFFKKKSPERIEAENELNNIRKAISIHINTVEKAKRDLADVSRDDVYDMLERGMITEQQASDFLNSIDSLELIVSNSSNTISVLKNFEKELLQKIKLL